MKKMLMAPLSLALAIGVLFITAGAGPYTPPAKDSLQMGNYGFNVAYPPPKKICKDEQQPFTVGYIKKDVNVPIEILALTDAGTLSQDYVNAPAGVPLGILSTVLTAKNVGNRQISFETMGAEKIVLNFEVVSCDYKLELRASEDHETDLVNWYMTVEGSARLSSEESMASKDGFYSLSLFGTIQDEDLKSGSEGLECALAGTSEADGKFDVTGSKNKDNITLSVQFEETDFGEGVALYCKDKNGSEGLTPLFKSQKVNPGNSVDLSPSFSKGVSTYKFTFGNSGSGQYTLIKRSKK